MEHKTVKRSKPEKEIKSN